MRIGIITHYHNSTNYGGNLQAYALCKVLNDRGHEAEQIDYDKKGDVLFAKRKGLSGAVRSVAGRLGRLLTRRSSTVAQGLAVRTQAVLKFNRERIPHSSVCYRKDTVAQTNEKYDVFVTGSDQVWHPTAVCSAYLLDFVRADKTKLSYAASVAMNRMPPQVLQRYGQSLVDFSAISVREQDALELIAPISPVPVEWVLDPTLLLNRQDWDALCSERIISQPYLFCYFLGDDPNQRELARRYAREKGLRLVTMPHLCGREMAGDRNFGEVDLYEVDPGGFVSLIRDAECVFTDSFHATAFSLIYEKQFFVFRRSGHAAMSGRIHSLLELVNAKHRFCDTPQRAIWDYIQTAPPACYTDKDALESMRARSLAFLLGSISNVEKKKKT